MVKEGVEVVVKDLDNLDDGKTALHMIEIIWAVAIIIQADPTKLHDMVGKTKESFFFEGAILTFIYTNQKK